MSCSSAGVCPFCLNHDVILLTELHGSPDPVLKNISLICNEDAYLLTTAVVV